MIVVLFEVWPHEESRQTYFDIAAQLRADLENQPGFISVERFESLSAPGKILSMSFWRDEDAVAQWRRREKHLEAQLNGRAHLFRAYDIRVAEVLRAYGMHDRAQAPSDFAGR
ncbi:MAG: antibiotic biosynthesis monooxygenase [Vicinamibacterales bacterium]